ncbi:MAG TPA: hypothetical protein EYP33_03420 [Pyrodictium sp.]|nr:hypothetical protein [Pyrodictium sp.]
MEGMQEALFFLARRPQAIRLLKVAAQYKTAKGKGPYTRELLKLAANGDRGYSMQLLKELQALGLLRRYKDRHEESNVPVIRNEPTPLAFKILAFFEGDEDA